MPDETVYTVQEQIEDTSASRPHVVILGAGASRAACPDGDRYGRQLPLMDDMIETLDLRPLLEACSLDVDDTNFEALFSRVQADPSNVDLCDELEGRVGTYFSGLRLPDEPTIYDHLVLSLRAKDAIATFNWDPFLWQAAERNAEFFSGPDIFFLHGCAILGYCPEHGREGRTCSNCEVCGSARQSVPLLYPVEKKEYTKNTYISAQWTALESLLDRALIVTIFGYGAPETDVEAMELMAKAWGSPDSREMEEIEIIDRLGCDEDEMAARWQGFIHTHHYQVHDNYFDSILAKSPRRSVEMQTQRLWGAQFCEWNCVAQPDTLEQARDWYSDLEQAEESSDERSERSGL